MTERASWKNTKGPKSETAERAYEDEGRISEFRELVFRLRTEAELSGRMGTTQSAIARMEGGGTRPALETLEKLASAVDQDPVAGVGAQLDDGRSDRQTGSRRTCGGSGGQLTQPVVGSPA